MIVNPDHIGKRRFGPGAFFYHGILQTCGRSDDPWFGLIGSEEFHSLLPGAGRFLRFRFLHIADDTGICLLFVQQEVSVLIYVADGMHHDRRIDVRDILLFIEIGQAQTDGIA